MNGKCSLQFGMDDRIILSHFERLIIRKSTVPVRALRSARTVNFRILSSRARAHAQSMLRNRTPKDAMEDRFLSYLTPKFHRN